MSNDVGELGSETAQEISVFYYTAADHNILLESDIKTEIVDQLTIFPMPHAPTWCSGMVSLRGKIIPVLDMAHMLGTEPKSNARWLLILESTPLPLIAIKIDKLPSRLSYSEDQVGIIESGHYPNWLTSIIKTEDLTLFKADHNTLFQQLIDENLSKQATQHKNTNRPQEPLEEEA